MQLGSNVPYSYTKWEESMEQVKITDEALPMLKSGIALKEKLLTVKAESYLNRLKSFEKKHKMKSAEFFNAFKAGSVCRRSPIAPGLKKSTFFISIFVRYYMPMSSICKENIPVASFLCRLSGYQVSKGKDGLHGLKMNWTL